MPSGRTHDRITLWMLPLLAGGAFGLTQRAEVTILITAGFLFGGLMFGPDLDIHSAQYKRWGPLRWIWLPYRQAMHHRSLLSHGLVIGTLGRVLYFTIGLGIFVNLVILGIAIVQHYLGTLPDWPSFVWQASQTTTSTLLQAIQQHPVESLAALVGLELGAMSHIMADTIGSAYKRWRRKQEG
jgi:uncharacterized metal-binding protein